MNKAKNRNSWVFSIERFRNGDMPYLRNPDIKIRFLTETSDEERPLIGLVQGIGEPMAWTADGRPRNVDDSDYDLVHVPKTTDVRVVLYAENGVVQAKTIPLYGKRGWLPYEVLADVTLQVELP